MASRKRKINLAAAHHLDGRVFGQSRWLPPQSPDSFSGILVLGPLVRGERLNGLRSYSGLVGREGGRGHSWGAVTASRSISASSASKQETTTLNILLKKKQNKQEFFLTISACQQESKQETTTLNILLRNSKQTKTKKQKIIKACWDPHFQILANPPWLLSYPPKFSHL